MNTKIVNKTAKGYREISVSQIVANPDQPRKFFEPVSLQELADSIRETGLLQPVTVRKNDEGTTYTLIAGERRWRACQMAEVATITAHVIEVDERTAFISSVKENVVRKDMTIMEEVDAYARLRDEFAMPTAEIAVLFGKTNDMIEWRLGFLTLCEEGRKHLNEETLKPNLAWYIARLEEADQKFVIQRYMKGDFKGEFEASNFARALHMRSAQPSLLEMPAEMADTEGAKAERKAKRARVMSQVEKIAKMAEMLSEIAGQDPEEFALAMGDDTAPWAGSMEGLAKVVTKARRMARQAKGFAEAHTYKVSDDMVAEEAPAAE